MFPLEFLSLFIQDPCNHCPDSIFCFYSFSVILHLSLSREVWQLISTFMFEKNIVTIEYYEYVKGDGTAKRSRKSRFWKTNCFQFQKIVTLFKQTDEKTAIQAEILLYRLVFFYLWVPLPTCIDLGLNLCFQFVRLKRERPKTFPGTLVSPHGFYFGNLFPRFVYGNQRLTSRTLRKQSQLKTECRVRYKCNVYRWNTGNELDVLLCKGVFPTDHAAANVNCYRNVNSIRLN